MNLVTCGHHARDAKKRVDAPPRSLRPGGEAAVGAFMEDEPRELVDRRLCSRGRPADASPAKVETSTLYYGAPEVFAALGQSTIYLPNYPFERGGKHGKDIPSLTVRSDVAKTTCDCEYSGSRRNRSCRALRSACRHSLPAIPHADPIRAGTASLGSSHRSAAPARAGAADGLEQRYRS